MPHKIHDVGVSKFIGNYSDAIEVAPGQRWLFTSGTPGVLEDGTFPKTIEEQSRAAWHSILAALEAAKMTPADLVKVSTSLTSADYVKPYVAIRRQVLGEIQPAFMLSIVTELIKPGVFVEVEVIAAAK